MDIRKGNAILDLLISSPRVKLSDNLERKFSQTMIAASQKSPVLRSRYFYACQHHPMMVSPTL